MEAVCRLDYPADKCEVILARGKQPSAQRNRAVERAQGELIYFLDDDSMDSLCGRKVDLITTPEQSRDSVRIIDAEKKSAKTGNTINL